MDQRVGRTFVPERGIRVAGTAAVTGLTKKCGLIDFAKGKFERLHATEFRISAAVIQALSSPQTSHSPPPPLPSG